MAIKKGDTVCVEYTGKFDNGQVFDSSKGRAPLEFKAGTGQVIKGFDESVIGMSKGQEKDIKIEPQNAYGLRNDDLVKEIPRKVMPPNMELKEGMTMILKSPDGHQIGAMLKEIKEDTVVIDLNHPLAGKALNFKIKIVDIK